MKKRVAFRRMGVSRQHKWAMLRSLVQNLVEHERIVTTVAKAKEMQRLAEKIITTAKKPDKLHARRQINKIIYIPHVQSKLMNVLAPRYEFRQGGYTRILKLAKPRNGDAADMAVIEYVDRPGEIRAARPPSALQNLTLEEVMAKLGLEEKQVDGPELSEIESDLEESDEEPDDSSTKNSEEAKK
mmetsp:Transcript_21552/g.46718  ORF Transcript_21552/g.46718 Transcript_21552/m.46718 type:complete len:185 (+) Transcript_21552:63-617(+)